MVGPRKLTKKQQKWHDDTVRRCENEGKAAWESGQSVDTNPYRAESFEGQHWRSGWYGAQYEVKRVDMYFIEKWLAANVAVIANDLSRRPPSGMCHALAFLIVHHENYDRTKPIPGNCLLGESFDIPAPVTLRP